MDNPITLWFDDADYAAILAAATRYRDTPEDRLRAWITEAVADERRHFASNRAERRLRVLEADPVLAAAVDAKATEIGVTDGGRR